MRAVVLLLPLLVLFTGCRKTLRVDDAQLKPIQDMLDAELPAGTARERVVSFLDARAYAKENPEKKGTVVAIFRQADAQNAQPVTARVTFYFDANGKLNTFEIQRTLNQPLPVSR